MPRNEAADRYSPEIALAFATGLTVRDATRKSDVLRATRTPNDPMTAETTPTSVMAINATSAGVLDSCTWSAKFCSTRSAVRVCHHPMGEQERVDEEAQQQPGQPQPQHVDLADRREHAKSTGSEPSVSAANAANRSATRQLRADEVGAQELADRRALLDVDDRAHRPGHALALGEHHAHPLGGPLGVGLVRSGEPGAARRLGGGVVRRLRRALSGMTAGTGGGSASADHRISSSIPASRTRRRSSSSSVELVVHELVVPSELAVHELAVHELAVHELAVHELAVHRPSSTGPGSARRTTAGRVSWVGPSGIGRRGPGYRGSGWPGPGRRGRAPRHSGGDLSRGARSGGPMGTPEEGPARLRRAVVAWAGARPGTAPQPAAARRAGTATAPRRARKGEPAGTATRRRTVPAAAGPGSRAARTRWRARGSPDTGSDGRPGSGGPAAGPRSARRGPVHGSAAAPRRGGRGAVARGVGARGVGARGVGARGFRRGAGAAPAERARPRAAGGRRNGGEPGRWRGSGRRCRDGRAGPSSSSSSWRCAARSPRAATPSRRCRSPRPSRSAPARNGRCPDRGPPTAGRRR